MIEIMLKGIVEIVKLPFNIILFVPLLLLKVVVSPRIKLWH